MAAIYAQIRGCDWLIARQFRHSNSSLLLESPIAWRHILLPDELYGDDSVSPEVRLVIRVRKLLAQSVIVGQVCLSV